MQRNLRVLSFDLDFLNSCPDKTGFVLRLTRRLQLPRTVFWMREHHYLYPLVVRLLHARRAATVDVVNLDEHHDFYDAASITNYDCGWVGCGNFFPFMVHDGVLREYTWVHNARKALNRLKRSDLLAETTGHPWDADADVLRRAVVMPAASMWSRAWAAPFDVFAVCESPGWTDSCVKTACSVRRLLRGNGFRVTRRLDARRAFRRAELPRIDMRPLFRRATLPVISGRRRS